MVALSQNYVIQDNAVDTEHALCFRTTFIYDDDNSTKRMFLCHLLGLLNLLLANRANPTLQ